MYCTDVVSGASCTASAHLVQGHSRHGCEHSTSAVHRERIHALSRRRHVLGLECRRSVDSATLSARSSNAHGRSDPMPLLPFRASATAAIRPTAHPTHSTPSPHTHNAGLSSISSWRPASTTASGGGLSRVESSSAPSAWSSSVRGGSGKLTEQAPVAIPSRWDLSAA